MDSLRQIVDQTIQVLEQMKRDGVTHLPVKAATLEELGKLPPPPPRSTVNSTPAVPVKLNPPDHAALPSDLGALREIVAACTRCAELSSKRTNIVFGVGDPKAELMFIGEAPGADEDREGEPFVGRAGELLTKIIQAMGYKRSEVYIANILKCRPPNNRVPLPDESANCKPYLRKQIELIRPKVIVTLGATALRGLLGVETAISATRGQWRLYEDIAVMPTFHPAYLLRNPAAKREVWTDMKAVMAKLGRELPPQPK
jgi:uracil-DNA glycosylase family 4